MRDREMVPADDAALIAKGHEAERQLSLVAEKFDKLRGALNDKMLAAKDKDSCWEARQAIDILDNVRRQLLSDVDSARIADAAQAARGQE